MGASSGSAAPNEPRALTGGPRERRERGSLAQMLPSATVAVRTVALPRPVCPPAWTLTGMIRFSQLSPFAARRTTWHGIWAGGEWCSCQRHDGAGACGAVCGAVESSQRSTDWPDRADPGELPPSRPVRAWTTNCSRHVLTRDEHYCRSILRSMSMPNTVRQPAGHVFRRRRCSLICRRSFQMWRQT